MASSGMLRRITFPCPLRTPSPSPLPHPPLHATARPALHALHALHAPRPRLVRCRADKESSSSSESEEDKRAALEQSFAAMAGKGFGGSAGKAKEPADLPPPDPLQQNVLATTLNIETGKLKVEEFAQEKEERLQQYLDEANSQFDELSKEIKERNDAYFATLLADIEKEERELEESIAEDKRKSMEKREATTSLEARLIRERNAGLFNQSLYSGSDDVETTDKQEPAYEGPESFFGGGQNVKGYYGILALGLLSLTGAAIFRGTDLGRFEFVFFTVIFLILGFQLILEQTLLPSKDNDDEN